jgi:hypothetical protein
MVVINHFIYVGYRNDYLMYEALQTQQKSDLLLQIYSNTDNYSK